MSQGSMIMGTTSGKLGNMVLYRAGGQERQRAYISKIANPQSDAQTFQRAKFRVAGVGYKAFTAASERIKLSSRATSAYNAFISKNVSVAPYHYKNFVEYCAQNGFSLPAPWQVANGSLVTPSFLQGANVSYAAESSVHSYASFSVSISQSDIASLGIASGSITGRELCQIIWAALGISSDIHICSSVGQGFTVTENPYAQYTNKVAIVSNFHDLIEFWPLSDNLNTQQIVSLSSGGAISVLGTTLVNGGVCLVGPVLSVSSNSYCPVEVKIATDSDTSVVTFTLYFNDVPDTSVTKAGQFASIWVANGASYATSTASLVLSSTLTTAYSALLGDAWRDLVKSSWKVSSSSSNEGVYQG